MLIEMIRPAHAVECGFCINEPGLSLIIERNSMLNGPADQMAPLTAYNFSWSVGFDLSPAVSLLAKVIATGFPPKAA